MKLKLRMIAMDYNQAMKLIGGLSTPSKMPWYGWSTPATACITGSKLRQIKGSTCGSCYALKGRYMFPHVQECLQRRLDAVKDPLFVDAFVMVLTRLHQNTKATYKTHAIGKSAKENRFRWHDSGDISSLEHIVKINEIALRTPQLRHWLPTRELGILKEFLALHTVAPNLTIRYSVPMVGARMKTGPFGFTQSTVGRDNDRDIHQCPAPTQKNKCMNCAACWKLGVDVNYKLH
jgi:hypothetical protein